ncbi:exosome non-catalytic core subunit RRP42 [Aspergillus novofumigatus IBT 16806]|uniref:Ribosomal RNA-processing protein 42 n=1 Tax=Aspergillus novofumigatus (strain IBT 16806) TaxID=1392255 RepID=A0A2I1CNB2_ASPN1|nr:putative exoribonuclease family protein [Aspergillus novofumigatus IBT 16806]PKX99118.1 putative exoribonuclease family protein [Aspergillus novofumigatus IBT 16806]
MSAQRQASSASQTPHLSPAELSYLYTSLALPDSPIRPDGRSPTQFRPLTAETDILPGTNGSARVGFADGTQAIVGVKAEVEKTALAAEALKVSQLSLGDDYTADQGTDGKEGMGAAGGHESWVQISIEIPGFRDDDALPVFLSEMMREPLIESVSSVQGGDVGMAGGLKGRLVINRRWHWRLYIDVLLLSQPLSYPLPLLSLTTHLALLSTRLPKLKSKGEEDPFFDDDWNVAEYLYPRQSSGKAATPSPWQFVRPPVTLLVISVADNIIFDPSREEIAVADTVLALSVSRDGETGSLKLLSIRTIDPPSRLTQPAVPNSENVATIGSFAAAEDAAILSPSTGEEEVPGVWRPRRGGVKRSTIARMVKAVLEKGGVGEDVLEGLEGVSVG